MSLLLSELRARKCEIADEQSHTAKSKPKSAPSKAASPDPNIELAMKDKLIHFVRAPLQGQWPGETRADYIRWLCSGECFVPRDDFNTLRRILSMRTLLASGALIPGLVPAVCFTAQTLAQIQAQRRWRPGLARWTFSSYGLAFERDLLQTCGARKVQYVEDIPPDSPDIALLQLRSTAAGKWSDELEWRIVGDLDFSEIQPTVLCSNETEAAALRKKFKIQALSITSS